MSFFYDAKNEPKREQNERGRRSNPNERGRGVDTNRDGDSQRNRSDRELFGPEQL